MSEGWKDSEQLWKFSLLSLMILREEEKFCLYLRPPWSGTIMYAGFFKCWFRGFGNEAGVSSAEYVCPFRLPKSDTPHKAGKTTLVKDD
jgi:hypothetical protein